MTKFAASTSVSPERSRGEIETILKRYGADRFGYFTSREQATIGFEYRGLSIRFDVPMPQPGEVEKSEKGYRRRADLAAKALEQAERQRWRALVLAIKAKLEVVDSGISTFESEFLAHIVTKEGATVGQLLLPKLHRLHEGASPQALLGP